MNPDSALARHLALQEQIKSGHFDKEAVRRMLDGTFMEIVTYGAILRLTTEKLHPTHLRERLSRDFTFADEVEQLEQTSLDFCSTRGHLLVTLTSTDVLPSIMRSDLGATSQDIVAYGATQNLFQAGFSIFYWIFTARFLKPSLVVALDTRGMIDGEVHVICAEPPITHLDRRGRIFTKPYDSIWPAGTTFILWRPVSATP